MVFNFENTRPEISDADLLDDLRHVGSKVAHDGILTKRAYQREGRYAVGTFQKRFGSWRAATEAAGFRTGGERDILDTQLFDNLRDCWMRLGGQPRKRDMMPPFSKFSHHPYVRRFGSWLNAMKVFCEMANDEFFGDSDEPKTVARRGPRDPSLRLRFLVMRRDSFRCVLCGRSPATAQDIVLHIDHVLAWSRGGVTEASNLRTLCAECNLGKSDMHATNGSERDE